MPAKWKPSERQTRIRNAENKLVTVPRAKARFKHYYLHQTPKQELKLCNHQSLPIAAPY